MGEAKQGQPEHDIPSEMKRSKEKSNKRLGGNGAKNSPKKQLTKKISMQSDAAKIGKAEMKSRALAQVLSKLRDIYPNTPSQLFTEPDQFLKEQQSFAGEIRKTKGHTKRECSWVATSEDFGTLAGFGSAHSSLLASKLAAGDLVFKLHEMGLLQDGSLFSLDKPTDQEIFTEHSTIQSVYGRCAKIPTLPKITLRPFPAFHGRPNCVFVLSIELPEYGIHVKAKCRTVRQAETVACLRFAAAFDNHLKLREESSNLPDWKVDTAAGLTYANAMSFLKWYRNNTVPHNSSSQVNFSLENLGGFPKQKILAPSRSFFLLDEQIVGEPGLIPCPEKKTYKAVAALAAAVSLASKNPELVREFLNAPRGSDGNFPRRMPPINLHLDQEGKKIMAKAATEFSYHYDIQHSIICEPGEAASGKIMLDREDQDEESDEFKEYGLEKISGERRKARSKF